MTNPTTEPLTELEHQALQMTMELADLMRQIIMTGNDRDRMDQDAAEVRHHIHALQTRVMAQAAGRAYPNLYRLLGSRWNSRE